MTAQEMWQLFKEKSGVDHDTYEAWQFGDDADRLASLVLEGTKTATSSAYVWYEIEKEDLPQEGEYSVILNSKDEAVCIIQTTKVYVVCFKEISEEHAFYEGEGDRTLEYWREVHKRFFSGELSAVNIPFSEDLLVVCEEFRRVY